MEDGLHLQRDATDLSRVNKIGAEVLDPHDKHLRLNLFTTGEPNFYTQFPLESRENFTNMKNYAFASRLFVGKTFVKYILIY